MTDINGLVNPFENSVYNQNLTQLEKEKQIRDYLGAVVDLGYTVPTGIIVDLNQLIADDVVSLGAIETFNIVLLEAFAKMGPGQLLEFTPSELLGLSPDQIAALSPDVFSTMTFDLLSALSLDALGGIKATQIAQISVDVFSQLTFEMFSALSPDALAAITPEQIAEVLVDVFAVMTSDLLAALSDGALAGVTAAQIAAFPVNEFAALTSAELASLSPDAFAGVTGEQIAALPAGVFGVLTGDQITALSPAALGAATADQLATLDPAVLEALQNSGQVLAITSDGEELDGDLSAASFSIQEHSRSVTTVEAASPLGLALAYTLTGADADAFEIDAFGALSFKTDPDFETPQSSDGDNVYEVTVGVSDGVQSDTQAISVSVTDVNDNAPVIDGGSTASIDVAENTTVVTQITATDADAGTSLSYGIVSGVGDGDLFSIDGDGNLRFLAAPDFENTAGINTYGVTVEVSDGELTDTQAITVTVTNDTADDNVTAPMITSNGGLDTADVQVLENATAVTTVTSIDPDPVGDRIYSIFGGDDELLFNINAQSGALSFVHAPDFETPQSSDGDNVYEVTVQVSDGVQSDTQAISVEVLNLDDSPPEITSDGGEETATVSITEELQAEDVVTTVTFADPDDPTDAGIYTFDIIGGADSDLFEIDSSGDLRFASDTGPYPDGDREYEVKVEVSDEEGNSDTQKILVDVDVVDDPVDPPNVQIINEFGNSGPREFMGQINTIDVFVFDAAQLLDGFTRIEIQQFDIEEDYLVFKNYELDGDNMPSDVDFDRFAENGPNGINLTSFSPGAVTVAQDRDFAEISDTVILVSADFGPGGRIDLRESFSSEYSSGKVTDQMEVVQFYAGEFDMG